MKFYPEECPVYDSAEEEYFSWYLDDLVEAGIVKKYFKPRAVTLIEKKTVDIALTRSINQKTLLNQLTYTPDFVIYWEDVKDVIPFIKSYYINTKEGDKCFFYYTVLKESEGGHMQSVIDVKPNFNSSRAHSNTSFPIKQKLMFDMYDTLVQKVICYPNGKKKGTRHHLFPSTFVPSRYTLTDKSLKPRKINFDYKTLNEFLKCQEKDNPLTLNQLNGKKLNIKHV